MRRIIDHRPAPATAISFLALFVALGGVSYGVATGSIDSREITDNAIRGKDVRNDNLTSRDLRNNQILAIDIRNRTLRARDIALDTLTDDEIDESKLTQVPSAADADRLGGFAAAEYARRAEPVRLIGTTGEPGFAAGVSASGGADLSPGFWRDGVGIVELQGSVSGPIGGGTLFTLPAGYEPAARVRFRVPVAGTGATTVEIGADGTVSAADPDASLDGIAFRVAGG